MKNQNDNNVVQHSNNAQLNVVETLTLQPNAQRSVYKSKTLKFTLHSGQRKLLISEIDFLTKHGHLSNDILYIGAASGNHIEYLSVLFPDHTFELWDPAKFAPNIVTYANNNPTKVRIISKYFTDEDAHFYKTKKILMICDIRTTGNRQLSDDDHEWEQEIMLNMDLQKKWIDMMTPMMSMIKFRLPYPKKDMKNIVRYFSGEVRLQCWAPQASTECRLITDGKSMCDYDLRKHEEIMYHFNTVTRIQYYDHNLIENLTNKDIPGIDHCHDCSGEIYILKEYLRGNNDLINDEEIRYEIIEIMKNISKICKTTELNTPPHGLHSDEKDVNKRVELLKPFALKVAHRKEQKEEMTYYSSHDRRKKDREYIEKVQKK